MTDLIDSLKDRLERAKVRLTNAQQAHQAAQAELNAAAGEFNVWNSVVALEIREEERRIAESRDKQIPMDLPEISPPQNQEPPSQIGPTVNVSEGAAPVNKTEKVREILREHGSGITPSGLWTEVKDYFSSRAYLYAILKRLRDHDEVSVRRGKYILKQRPLEMGSADSEVVVIQ